MQTDTVSKNPEIYDDNYVGNGKAIGIALLVGSSGMFGLTYVVGSYGLKLLEKHDMTVQSKEIVLPEDTSAAVLVDPESASKLDMVKQNTITYDQAVKQMTTIPAATPRKHEPK